MSRSLHTVTRDPMSPHATNPNHVNPIQRGVSMNDTPIFTQTMRVRDSIPRKTSKPRAINDGSGCLSPG